MKHGVKFTTEQFLERARAQHGDKFSYPDLEYKSAKSEISVICPVHGKFTQKAFDHYRSKHGCPKCASEYMTKAQTFTLEDFIRISKLAHGDKYDYSLVNYTVAKAKVKIICKKHGCFEQEAFNHMKGKGCRGCANDVLFEQRKADYNHFLKRATVRHGDRFDYSKVKYVNAKTAVTIICKQHGEFLAVPDVHWNSGGLCPDCDDYKSGFDKNRAGILYVIRAGNITKIGITNSKPESRLKSISLSSGFTFKTIKNFYFDDGVLVNALETKLIRILRENHNQPQFKFDGYTEAFFDVDIDWLLTTIEKESKILKGEYEESKTEERET